MRQDVEAAVIKAAKHHGLEPAALLAVVDIESSGDPFENDGVTPRFLFERHIFYRQINALAPGKLQDAIDAGLANASWQPASQYKDQGTSAHRLDLFARACAIHPEAAYRSASWGVGQTMGFNCARLGYQNAQAMVDAMRGNVDAQLEAMVGEILSNHLDIPLKGHNWARFALGYNGKGYRTNRYDERLAAAYAKWSRMPTAQESETQTAGVQDPEASGDLYVSRPSATPYFDARLQDVQRKLRALGYPVGGVDGRHGKLTASAIEAFQHENGLTGDRGCWYASYDGVLATAKPFVGEERASKSVRDFSQTDRLGRRLSWLEKILAFLGLSSAATQSLPDTAQALTGGLGAFSGLWQLIVGHKVLILVTVALAAALAVRFALTELTHAYRRLDYQGTTDSPGGE